jgi:hypothetical protein
MVSSKSLNPKLEWDFKKNLGMVLVFEWSWNQTSNLVLITYNFIIKGWFQFSSIIDSHVLISIPKMGFDFSFSFKT